MSSKKQERKKVVLDVNIVISALFGGKPLQAVKKAETMKILISDSIKEEFNLVIEELADKLKEPQKKVFRKLLKQLFNKAESVEISGKLAICRDPNDDIYLETCQKGRVHYLVSGDKDLLEIDPAVLKKNRLGRLKILNPSEFCEE